eukprot:CCRYP_014768-RB/>CCRYP_014768-RB protein AED:0.27 eAED:0.28 QI:0/0/0.5/1/0/0.5/2/244/141
MSHLCANLRGSFQEDNFTSDPYEEHRLLKMTAAQKRQQQRDKRRNKLDPDRLDAQNWNERVRKYNQAKNTDRPWADPYNPNYGEANYAGNRESYRRWRCEKTGRDCNWKALDLNPVKTGVNDWDTIYNEEYNLFDAGDLWP